MVLSKKHCDAIVNGHRMGNAVINGHRFTVRETQSLHETRSLHETQSLRLYSGVIAQMPKRANGHRPVVETHWMRLKKMSPDEMRPHWMRLKKSSPDKMRPHWMRLKKMSPDEKRPHWMRLKKSSPDKFISGPFNLKHYRLRFYFSQNHQKIPIE